MKTELLKTFKSFIFGEKCSLCHKTMHRSIDDWYQKNNCWEIFLEYECRDCQSYMSAINYKWTNKGYRLIDDYYFHISASDPAVGDIYEPMKLEGISNCMATIPISSTFISIQDINYVNELVKKLILLS